MGAPGLDAPKTKLRVARRGWHTEGGTLRVPPVPRFWGPGRPRTSIDKKKPKVYQDRSRKAPFSPRSDSNLFQPPIAQNLPRLRYCGFSNHSRFHASQGPAAPRPYLAAQNVARKSLFMRFLRLKSFNLKCLRLPMTRLCQQPTQNQQFRKNRGGGGYGPGTCLTVWAGEAPDAAQFCNRARSIASARARSSSVSTPMVSLGAFAT